MNRKKIKKLRRKAKEILVDWLKSLLPEEEQDKININNIIQLMPSQTHYNPHWTLKEMSKSALPSARALSREDKDD